MDCIKKVEDLLNELKGTTIPDPIKIVVLQRGWIVIGRLSKVGTQCFIRNGYVIRRWGTTEGLGELATKGKLTDTKLDTIPLTEFHELTIILSLSCDEDKWNALIK